MTVGCLGHRQSNLCARGFRRSRFQPIGLNTEWTSWLLKRPPSSPGIQIESRGLSLAITLAGAKGMVMRNQACFLFAGVFRRLAQRLLQHLAFLGERQRVRMH